MGIFPYVLKLLQSSARELRPLLVFIWAKILAVDSVSSPCPSGAQGHLHVPRATLLAEPRRPARWRWVPRAGGVPRARCQGPAPLSLPRWPRTSCPAHLPAPSAAGPSSRPEGASAPLCRPAVSLPSRTHVAAVPHPARCFLPAPHRARPTGLLCLCWCFAVLPWPWGWSRGGPGFPCEARPCGTGGHFSPATAQPASPCQPLLVPVGPAAPVSSAEVEGCAEGCR